MATKDSTPASVKALATVRPPSWMPTGVPVACVAINGAKNAAILATQILGTSDAVYRDAIVALKAEQFVPGHGNIMSKDDIQQRLARVETKRAKVKELVAQGKSLAEIKTALGDPVPAAGGRGPAFPSLTEVIYRELTNKTS